MVSSASQRGRVLLKRSACQHSRPPIKGISTSQGRIMTGSFPCVNSWSGYREQQEAEHQHCTSGNGGGIPADLAILGPTQQGIAPSGQQRQDADGAVQRVTPQYAGQPQVGLHEDLVIEPIEAPGSEPQGSEYPPRSAVADPLHQSPLAQIQPGSKEDTGHGDRGRQDLKPHATLASGMADALRQHTGQRWSDPGADKGGQHYQCDQRQVMGQSATGMGLGLNLTMEHHEDQAEGIDRGQEGADQAGVQQGCIRSEEHTSELQSRPHLVCRLLLEKKNKNNRLDYMI